MLKNLTYLSTFTFIIILSWVAFGIYNTYTQTTINKDTQILITPIPAKFDLDVVNSITSRIVIEADLGSARKSATSSGVLPTAIPQILTPTAIPTPATNVPAASPIVTAPPATGAIPGLIVTPTSQPANNPL